MSSENIESLVPLLERFVIAMESIAGGMEKSPRKLSKSEELDRRVDHMLAWVEKTVETSQKRVAEEFSLSPSTLSKDRYESVRQAIEENKLARRRVLMTADTTPDDFTYEVLDE
ncbi:MAG: hypothetical protein ABJZ55_07270 [Fuerstiella sp.]